MAHHHKDSRCSKFWSSFILADAIITELLAKKHHSSIQTSHYTDSQIHVQRISDNRQSQYMEYYDNDVSVHSVYKQTVFYGLCLKIKYILSYLILITNAFCNYHQVIECVPSSSLFKMAREMDHKMLMI